MTTDDRIRAVHVIQRFVRMSRMLLPVFYELVHLERRKASDQSKINQIKEIYDNFVADPEVSRKLIGSDIIALIQETYNHLKGEHSQLESECKEYIQFIEESDRLIQTWEIAELN